MCIRDRNKWDVQVRGYVLPSDCNMKPWDFCYKAVREWMRENDMDGFEPNYFHVAGFQNGASYCGQGQLGGDKSVTYMMHICGVKTIIHELGHNLGLHHSGSRDENGVEREYGDTSSIMGSNEAIRGLTSPHLHHLGLETGRETLDIESTRQVLVAPVELQEAAMHNDEYQNVIVRKPDSVRYYLSMRKTKGTPWPLLPRDEDTLFIHEWNKGSMTRTKRLMPDLKPGQSRTLPNGVNIHYLEYANETARVNVLYPGDSTPADIPMPAGFPEPFAMPQFTEAHQGAWFEPRLNGQGFDIHVKDGKALVYWYTYDNRGNCRWYIATGNIVDNIMEAYVTTTRGGNFSNPASADVITIGKCQLYFYTKDRGVFNFSTEEHGRGSTEIQPVALAERPLPFLSGSWFDPHNQGDGISTQFYHGNTMVGYFYTYKRSYNRDTMQHWYYLQGTPDDMTIYNGVNGKFLSDSAFELVPVGTGKITIDEDICTFTYDLGNATGVKNYRRLW